MSDDLKENRPELLDIPFAGPTKASTLVQRQLLHHLARGYDFRAQYSILFEDSEVEIDPDSPEQLLVLEFTRRRERLFNIIVKGCVVYSFTKEEWDAERSSLERINGIGSEVLEKVDALLINTDIDSSVSVESNTLGITVSSYTLNYQNFKLWLISILGKKTIILGNDEVSLNLADVGPDQILNYLNNLPISFRQGANNAFRDMMGIIERNSDLLKN